MHHRILAPQLLAFAVAGVLGHLSPTCSQANATPAYEATPLRGRANPKRDYYPAPAIRQGITGRVCLAYSVDNRGHATNIEVLESGGPLLDGAARQFITAFGFNLPSGWAATAGSAKRYRLGVVFDLASKPRVPLYGDSIPTVVIPAPL
jgi:TonB family protein